MKFRLTIFFTLLLVLLFLMVAQTKAIGIGIKPSYLEVSLNEREKITTSLRVYNISNEPAQFRIYADELIDWLKITPTEFRLEAQETKVVKIEVEAKDSGRRSTNLSVVGSPLNKSQFNADSGVKVPLRLDVGKSQNKILGNLFTFMALWLGASVFIVLLVIYIVLKLRKRTFKERVVEKVEDVFRSKKHW